MKRSLSPNSETSVTELSPSDHQYQPGPIKGPSGRYYKQSYRKEWESMPDFKGWLTQVYGEPNRAFCIYCDKTLHAHRLSLLKHTCTLKHTRAAQKNFANRTTSSSTGLTEAIVAISSVSETPVENSDNYVDNTNQEMQNEDELIEEEEMHQQEISNQSGDGYDRAVTISLSTEVDLDESEVVPAMKIPRLEMSTPTDSPISTHILDTAKGNPVGGLHVSLYKLVEGRWTNISEGITTPDGRYTDFIKRDDFTAGRYKMHFDVDRYFELRRLESLYPFIEIVFDVKAPAEHYHVPLLLSPFGYTTYRGS